MAVDTPSLALALVSDLRPGRPPAGGPKEVDPDSLDALLAEAAPGIEVSVAGAPVRLSFAAFKDFRPDRIAARTPALGTLLEISKQALELAASGGDPASLRPSLAAHPELARFLEMPAAPAAPVPTGGVFDLVDSAPAADSPAKALDRLVEAMCPGSAADPRRRDALRLLSKRAADLTAPFLREILRHPRFRALESAWLGLRRLVRSIDFRAGARLHVVAADPPSRLDAVRGLALPLAADLRSRGRTVVLVLDAEFDGGEEDLRAISSTCAAASVPLVTGGGAACAIREAAARLGDAGQAGWDAFRNGEAAAWTVLATNAFRLRLPYGKDADPVRGLDFEEGPAEPALGGAAIVVASLLAASQAKHGWALDFAGREAAARLEPFPCTPPLQAELDEASARGLADAGLLPLASLRDSDRAFAASAGSARRGGASFRQALFAAQVSAGLQPLLAYLDPSKSPDEIARTIAAGVRLLGFAPGGAELYGVSASVADAPPAIDLVVTPSSGLLRGLAPLSFRIPLPR
jgi:hypothetical protein